VIPVVIGAACLFEDVASSGGCWGVNIGPVAAVGDSEYIGGGAFEGTVKAFMPGRLGRRVAVDGLVRGQGLLRGVSLLKA
jgi:hypothetical protein